MQKGEKLYEGKAKMIFATEDPDLVWVEYKDDATAFNGKKKGSIKDKGRYNNQISAILFNFLEDKGVPTHFKALIGAREMLVKKVDIIPIEVVARNIIAGSLAKRTGLEEGVILSEPVLEFYYKSDELDDPFINDYHIKMLELATEEQVEDIKKLTLKINEILFDLMKEKGLDLVDFKLEFGLFHGNVILGDEISPDTCRLWDTDTHNKLDKDRFRRDMGNVEDAYQEVLRRISE